MKTYDGFKVPSNIKPEIQEEYCKLNSGNCEDIHCEDCLYNDHNKATLKSFNKWLKEQCKIKNTKQ